MFTIKVEGLEKVQNKLKYLQDALDSTELNEFIAEKAIQVINQLARERLDQSDNYIESNHKKVTKDSILIYNDVHKEDGTIYAAMVEYGTGVYSTKGTIGKSESFKISGGLYWLVPVEEGNTLDGYGFEVITLDSGDYYKVYGQTPKFIYEDAAKIIEQRISKWGSEWVKTKIK